MNSHLSHQIPSLLLGDSVTPVLLVILFSLYNKIVLIGGFFIFWAPKVLVGKRSKTMVEAIHSHNMIQCKLYDITAIKMGCNKV